MTLNSSGTSFGPAPEEIKAILDEAGHALSMMSIDIKSRSCLGSRVLTVKADMKTSKLNIYHKPALKKWFFKFKIEVNYPKHVYKAFAVYTDGVVLGVHSPATDDVDIQLSDPSNNIREKLPELISESINASLRRSLEISRTELENAEREVRNFEKQLSSTDLGIKIGGITGER